MTALLCFVGRDTVFLAADCITHEPSTGRQRANDTQKIVLQGDKIAWATGGYAIANSRIAPILTDIAHGTEMSHINDVIVSVSKAINTEYAPRAALEGIAPPNVFSMMVGIDNDGLPRAFVNAPSLEQYITLKCGEWSGLGTVSERIHALASQRFEAHVRHGGIAADDWSIEVMRIASRAFPASIGFPIDMVSISSKRPMQMQRVSQSDGYRATSDWRVRL